MHIGIPKEIKTAERRVALTPAACETLVKAGHTVSLETTAGVAAGFPDSAYTAVGVKIEPSAKALYGAAQMIVKVKEPQKADLENLRKDHMLFCYLHLAAEPDLTAALQKIGLTAVAFETVEENGRTPLLAPMSAVAGRLAVQIGTWYLHAPRGGRGVLMGGITGMTGGNVLVLGAGVAGREAAAAAYGMNADVTVLDINQARLDELKAQFPKMTVRQSSAEAINELLPKADLLVGSVYIIGKHAPRLVTETQIKTMRPGSVVVDISIDQGGCIETSRPCTHEMPVYTVHGVIHSCITNMPGAVPVTSSQALSNAILPYVGQLAKGDWSPALMKGVNVKGGELKIAL